MDSTKGVGRPDHNIPSVRKGKNYVLAIGIDDYMHCPRLHNAVKDVQDFVELLLERYNFEPYNITQLFNSAATDSQIIEKFREIAVKVTPDDNLIIYFSGHGEYDKVLEQGFWVPVNAEKGEYHDYLPNSTIRDILNAIKSHHTFLIADSCFSGALFSSQDANRDIGDRREIDPSRWGLTAGRNEIVGDGKPGTNSPFAEKLLDLLRKNDKPLGVAEICAKMMEIVQANADQTPRGEPLKIKGHEGGQFFFHPQHTEETAWKRACEWHNETSYLSYLKAYPNGKYADDAKIAMREIADDVRWQKAKHENSVIAFYEYIEAFPNSKYVNEAKLSLENFEEKFNQIEPRKTTFEQQVLKEKLDKKYNDVEKPIWTTPIKLLLGFMAVLLVIAILWFKNKDKQQTVTQNPVTVTPSVPADETAFLQVKNENTTIKPTTTKPTTTKPATTKPTTTKPTTDRNDEDDTPVSPPSPRRIAAAFQLEPEMVTVRGGTFTMGCTSEQGSDCESDEKPAHQVNLSSFQIGKYEITQWQWWEVMRINPSNLKNCDDCPVEQVSWNDIQDFLQKLNNRTGKNYRLPTEAEWEFAARGGTRSNSYKYSGSNSIGNVAWYDENSKNKTHSIGQKEGNELGIHDMSGNVWEWCSDRYGNYSSSAVSNPTGATQGSGCVLRGGGWSSYPQSCRVAIRYSGSPAFRSGYLGFRVLLSP